MNKKIELSKDEMSLLIGGVVRLEFASQDVNNNNSIEYCGCIYHNSSAISNNNNADKCACVCM
ncbi:hypothetical protein CYCD_30030 [Tenuifilaceae bacterium CYCD]|nr:hypothetical protein CYCD_30030 [Tenuifilaceae bacterium CYCD]